MRFVELALLSLWSPIMGRRCKGIRPRIALEHVSSFVRQLDIRAGRKTDWRIV
jgi:hypothetical protein